MTGRALLAVAATVAVLGAAACTSSSGGPAAPGPSSGPPLVDLSTAWRRSAPAAANVDGPLLAAADLEAARLGFVRSLVVARGGELIDERYFGAASAATLADIRSGTKSVVSILVGEATSEGLLGGTGERLGDLLRPPVSGPTGAAAAVTIGDILTMRSGFAWDESTAAGYNAWALAPNQVGYLLARPIVDPPGTFFAYDSAAVHLLSVGLSQGSGGTTEAFAKRAVLGPLGVSGDAWERDNQGFDNGAAGLSLRPIDYAKLGQLILQRGSSGRQQVVRAAWIAAMLTPRLTVPYGLGPLDRLEYGYLWWIAEAHGHRLEFAWGYRGQFLVIVPDLDLVVVTTTVLDDPSINPDREAAATMGLIVDGVLPAAR